LDPARSKGTPRVKTVTKNLFMGFLLCLGPGPCMLAG
jgi:hypothetical protein